MHYTPPSPDDIDDYRLSVQILNTVIDMQRDSHSAQLLQLVTFVSEIVDEFSALQKLKTIFGSVADEKNAVFFLQQYGIVPAENG